MRNRLSLLALLVGCNEVYGLAKTEPIDAAFFDAPPPTCPATGTPPTFGQDFHQVVLQPCTDFTFASNGRALARCEGVISEGTLGEGLVPAAGLEQTTDLIYDHPRLHPDGELAVMRVTDRTMSRTFFGVFARTEAGWVKREELGVAYTMLGSSALTRDGHIVVVAAGGGLRELARDGNGVWSEVLVHSFTELGVTSLGDQVNLSSDGLRLLVVGTPAGANQIMLLYADRASETDPFSAVVPLPSLDYLPNGFLTEDCARLYFSALGTVFYTEHL